MNHAQAIEKIKTYIDSQRDEMTKTLSEFISVESITYNEGNAVQFLAGKMREFGYDEVRVDPVGNVLGRVGSGKTTFLYDAHVDTVELGDEKDWKFPPLSGTLHEGVIYGRGAVDDKGALIAATYAGKALKALGLDNDFTLWISGSISEEDVEGSCVEAMMKESPDIKPDYILVAEASDGCIMRGHKGRALIRITVPGKCAHASAAHHGDNALIKALPIIDGIDKFKDLPEDPFLGKGTIEVTKVDCKTPSLNTHTRRGRHHLRPPYFLRGDNRGPAQRSQAVFREHPRRKGEIDTEKVTTYTGYDITCVDYFPSWVVDEQHPLIQAGAEAFRSVFNKEPEITKWDFCTNATPPVRTHGHTGDRLRPRHRGALPLHRGSDRRGRTYQRVQVLRRAAAVHEEIIKHKEGAP
jgi:putative selenium metabolism hydrolase